jgi:hypothetical protein
LTAAICSGILPIVRVTFTFRICETCDSTPAAVRPTVCSAARHPL